MTSTRPFTSLLLLTLFATTTPAGDLAARLRARMKARPKPKVSRLAPQATPGNQAACQAQIDRSRRRKSRRRENGDAAWTDTWEFHRNLTQCAGAEAVARVMARTHAREVPIQDQITLRGKEPPGWRVSPRDGSGGTEVKVILGLRPARKRSEESIIEVGLETGKPKRGERGHHKSYAGVFRPTGQTTSEREMLVSLLGAGANILYPTEAPWACLRLDDGNLYFGQFSGGQPHGLGFCFDGRGAAGTFGYFQRGMPRGRHITWVTKSEPMIGFSKHAKEPRPVAADWVEQKVFDDGGIRDVVLLQNGGHLWSRPGEERNKANMSLWERWQQGEMEAKESLAAERRARANLWMSLAAGDVLHVVKHNGTAGPVVLLEPSKTSSAWSAWGTFPAVWSDNTFSRVPPGQTVDIPGFGTYTGSPADRARLMEASKPALTRTRAFAKKWRKEKAEKEAQDRVAPSSSGITTYAKPYRNPGSSGLGPAYTSPSPRPGTSAWHNERKISNPISYHQLKY